MLPEKRVKICIRDVGADTHQNQKIELWNGLQTTISRRDIRKLHLRRKTQKHYAEMKHWAMKG
jgi:hypothetical protein